MSNNDHDPFLEALFTESVADLTEGDFTSQVIVRAQRFSHVMIGCGAILVFTLAMVFWWLSIPWELARLTGQALAQPLVPLAEGWLAWLVSPVNNVGGLLVVAAKLGWMLRKWSRRQSLVD